MIANLLFQNPPILLICQLTVIIVVARLFGQVARYLGQSAVVAEIVAGIVLGPSVLQIVAPAAFATLFPLSGMNTLTALSELGLVLYLFLVGMEFDLASLRRRVMPGLFISHASLLVPLGLGSGLAWLVAQELAPEAVPQWVFVAFIGVAMSISAFPMLSRMLADHGFARTRLGKLALTTAALDDLTGWGLLALIFVLGRSHSWSGTLGALGLAAGFGILMLGLVRPLLARIGQTASDRQRVTPGMVAFCLVSLFAAVIVAHLVGTHALFGAFVMGLCMPHRGSFSRAIAEKVEDMVTIALLPLFFVLSGLQTDIRLLADAGSWSICAGLVVVAWVGKFGGGAVAARLTGISWRDAMALGVLLNTRGLMELVVLHVGREQGIVDPPMFTMLVVMTVLTTGLTQTLVTRLLRNPESTSSLPAAGVPSAVPPGIAAQGSLRAPRTADTQAHQVLSGHIAPQLHAFRLLLCVGQRSTGPSMLDVAVLLGSTGLGDATALHISRPSERTSALVSSDESDSFSEESTNALALMMERAQERNARIVPLATQSSFPAREILAAARRKSAELIVLGWHRPVISANILGGIVGEVIADSPVPVVILVSSGQTAPQRIVGLVSDSGSGRLVRELAFRMAHASGAELVLLAPSADGDTSGRHVEPVRDERFPMIRAVLITCAGTSNERAALEETGANTDLLLVPTDGSWGPSPAGVSLESSSLLTRMSGRTTLLVHARQDWQAPTVQTHPNASPVA